ncbi:MAG TPA: sugar phosphate isomerase/epimerase family protein [Gemmataceae bacterium]|jgi:sugar phosphate isomerase/epimerase|nr:sugar phosphate isomerase/epimerase family protein [Gemmataceae bacterium]
MSSLSRRHFLQTAAVTAAAGSLAAPATTTAAGNDDAPKFQLGIVTYNVAAKWDLPTVLKVLKDTKIGNVEFRTTHAHGVEPSLSSSQRQDVKKRCADAGIRIWGLGSICEFQAPDKSVVEKNIEDCKQFIGLAHDLGAKGVKVRPNGVPRNVPLEKTLDQIGKSLIPCGKAAADAGVEIFVEVHGQTTQNPPNIKTIMEHCGHPAVGVCWNSNGTDVKGGSVAESFKMLAPWLKSCHINDLYKDEQGVYPYRELFRLMRGVGYDRVTLCEVGKTPGSVADGTEMLRYYRALWMELARG